MNKLTFIATLLMPVFVISQQSAEQIMQAGKKLKQQGKCAEAVGFFIKATEAKNDNAEAFYETGWCYNELKEFGKAVEVLNKANVLWRNNPDVLYELGYAYYNLDSADVSMTFYQKALKIDTAHVQTMIGIGDIYRDKKSQIADALSWYLKAQTTDSGNIKANYWAGWCYNDLDDFSKAIPYLQTVVKDEPENYPALNELGYAHYSLRNYDEAVRVLLKTESAGAKAETALYYLGLCYVHTGKKQEAVKRYNALVLMNSKLAAGLLAEIQKMK